MAYHKRLLVESIVIWTTITSKLWSASAVLETISICSGVSQGFHLAPLLFLIFVNDLCNTLSSHFLLFADDLKLFRSVNNLPGIYLLQRDLSYIHAWCKDNDMHLNVDKCKVIVFSRAVRPSVPTYYISEVKKNCKIFIWSGTLEWFLIPSLLDSVISKATQMLGFILRHSMCSLLCLCFI